MNNTPCSIEAEESLLGAMLQTQFAIDVAISKIRSDDFYSQKQSDPDRYGRQ